MDRAGSRPPLFSIEEVFAAYHDCRRHKRNKQSALQFELDLEHNLVDLWEDLDSGLWKPGPANVFVIQKPVLREIFAAGFRDRIVHHALINRLNPYFEKSFIYDSYSCRVGKGTHFGINRVKRFIRQCSENHTVDAYVLKLDIRGFFMHIHRPLLLTLLEEFLDRCYPLSDKPELLGLCASLILNDPLTGCSLRSSPRLWQKLPSDKSLFGVAPEHGLPIGNLSSQVLANFYLNGLDHYCKHNLGLRYYGWYVDDMVIVHKDKAFLASCISLIGNWLARERRLELHPRKIRLQHCRKGVPFLGVYILPGRVYPGRRVCGNFRAALDKANSLVESVPPDKAACKEFLASTNSYLGILRHIASWRFRTELLCSHLSPWWKKRFVLPATAVKLVRKVR